MRKFSSVLIQNEALNLTSEHPSSSDHFDRKFQATISPSDQSLENKEEALTYFKEEHHDTSYKLGSFDTEISSLSASLYISFVDWR